MSTGRALVEPEWLSARIAEMGRSWGTASPRVAGTLWWCMLASALVEQAAASYARDERARPVRLDLLRFDVRPDGGIERVSLGDESLGDEADRGAGDGAAARLAPPPAEGRATEGNRECSDPGQVASGSGSGNEGFGAAENAPAALRETLSAVIPPVAAVSGAGVPSLWAIAADAIGNRALDAGCPEAGARLAADIGGKLPAPRFVEIGGRTFVRRVSCCLVYEAPGCQMCTSCPKRPPAERRALLAEVAARE